MKTLGTCICSCGLCSSSETLCDKCVVDTLNANGLDYKYIPELTGLKKRSSSHSGFYATEFSELGLKLSSIVNNEYKKWLNEQ